MSTNSPKVRKPLRLPFEKRKKDGDWGSWIYEHRIGILTTVVVYMSCIIAFLSYRIVINQATNEMIAIEFEKEKLPEQEPTPEEIKQKEIEMLHEQAFAKAQNKISNENSKFNTSLRDSKKSNAEEIYKEAERVTREVAAGKAAYESGLAELSEASKKKPKTESSNQSAEKGDKNQRENVKGNVFVSYDLKNRTDTYLHKPAYQCQYGGMVVVNITVNQSGKVIAAVVDKATSSTDGCIIKMAEQSALASTFDASTSAPDKQKGTITYRFVPQ